MLSDKGYDKTFKGVAHPILKHFKDALPAKHVLDRDDLKKIMKEKTYENMPDITCIFPEGEGGNCKSFMSAYKTQPFKTGFLRLALDMDADIVLFTTTGFEEIFPSICKVVVKIGETEYIGCIPLGIFPPLHGKMQVKQYDVLDIDELRAELTDDAKIREKTKEIQEKLQQYLDTDSNPYWLKSFSSLFPVMSIKYSF